MPHRFLPYEIPDVIMLLGTDASGKDHVAGVLEKIIRDGGGDVEKRKHFFSGRTTREAYSTNKGFFDRLQERLFLTLFSFMGPLLPLLIGALSAYDAKRFRAPNKKLIVVGHNGLRALAFHWGREEETARRFRISDFLRRAFRLAHEKAGARVIVLDVDHAVRQKRIMRRAKEGVTDLFDRYMLQDPERSERIEQCLVRGAQELFGASVMVNNDLSAEEIKAHVLQTIGKEYGPDRTEHFYPL